jgi:hypothetical protein
MIEELVAFTSTHLAMVTLLMPWKKIVEIKTVGTAHVGTNILLSLFDMNNVAKWGKSMSPGNAEPELFNDDLPGTVHVLIGLAAAVLLMSIVSFVLRLMYNTLDPNVFSVIDFVNWGLTLGLLTVTLVNQGDFDESWKHDYRVGNVPADIGADTDKMFLSVGVIAVHLLMTTFFVGKDIMERLKN